MRLKNYLSEKRTNNVIVVDIQPMYKNFIYMKMDMFKFVDFLQKQRKILYFYNGPDTVGSDRKQDIIEWLMECSDYSEHLYNKLTKETIWYDKGYGFFRSWMDMGADNGFIKKAIRFMINKKVYDSRDIEPEEWKEKFPNDWIDKFQDDMIYLPDIPINKLKQFSGSYLVGGGKNECLKEIKILMSVFNIKCTEVKEFIY